ncbi:MAG: DUF4430 domain-containing protein [Clostridia bacterium]|nr:DUF4430 domain-containing protein [Clostridia bacterium]
MKKHKSKIIFGVLIVAILSLSFWYGGNAPGLRGWGSSSEDSISVSQSNVSVSPSEPSPTPDNQNNVQSVLSNEEKPATKEPTMIPVAKESETPPITNETIINENQEKDQYLTDPVPTGQPLPVEPQEVEVSKEELTCILSVRCDSILQHMEWFDQSKMELVPKDGVIYAERTVPFYDGESVFDVLLREMKQNGIHMEFEHTPLYNSAYIEGIANLYEFDCGELSGWMYKVNGWFPNYGCSRYQLKDKDRVEWIYTCELGADIGGYNAAFGNDIF